MIYIYDIFHNCTYLLLTAYGTLEIGYLSTIEAEANVTKRLSNIVVKAMAWSTDDKVFYYVDPRKPVIMAYDYNVDTAEMSKCKQISLILLFFL